MRVSTPTPDRGAAPTAADYHGRTIVEQLAGVCRGHYSSLDAWRVYLQHLARRANLGLQASLDADTWFFMYDGG